MPDAILRLLPPRCGRAWFLVGLAALGVVSLVAGRSLGPMFALPEFLPATAGVARALAGVLVCLSVACLLRPRSAWAALLLAAWLLVWLAAVRLPEVASKPESAAARVAAVEVLAAFSLSLWLVFRATRQDSSAQRDRQASRALAWLRFAPALMLLIFGITHLQHREAIASMIPEWLPARPVWPWLTGGANLAAGAALLSGVLLRPAALAVGLMFASWLPLVHAGRLLGSPASPTEWSFALTAVVLCGIVWTLAAHAPSDLKTQRVGDRREQNQE